MPARVALTVRVACRRQILVLYILPQYRKIDREAEMARAAQSAAVSARWLSLFLSNSHLLSFSSLSVPLWLSFSLFLSLTHAHTHARARGRTHTRKHISTQCARCLPSAHSCVCSHTSLALPAVQDSEDVRLMRRKRVRRNYWKMIIFSLFLIYPMVTSHFRTWRTMAHALPVHRCRRPSCARSCARPSTE